MVSFPEGNRRVRGWCCGAVAIALMSVTPALSGCNGCSDASQAVPSAKPRPTKPVPAPTDLVANIWFPQPQDTLQELRDAAGGRGMFLPRSVGGLAVQLLGLPLQAADQIDEKLPVVAALTAPTAEDGGASGAAQWAVAIHVRDVEQLRLRLTGGREHTHSLETDATAGVRWLVPGASARAAMAKTVLALHGHHLIVAADRPAVLALAPYLTRTLATSPLASPTAGKVGAVDVRVELTGPGLRAAIPAALGRLSTGLRNGALPASLRSLVDVDTVVSSAAELGNGLDGGTLWLQVAGPSLRLQGDLRLTAEGAKRLAALPSHSRASVQRLPEDSLVALAWTAGAEGRLAQAESRAKAAAALGQWPAADTQALAAALALVAQGQGERVMMALRCTGVGLTGLAQGDIADGDKLAEGLDGLVALREQSSLKALLDSRELEIHHKKIRMLRIPHDVGLLRLMPRDKDATAQARLLEAIDLRYTIADKRFLAAAGMETLDSLKYLYEPDAERSLGGRKDVAAAFALAPANNWLLGYVDPQGINACQAGQPGGGVVMPVILALGRDDDTSAEVVKLHVQAARPLVRVLARDLAGM